MDEQEGTLDFQALRAKFQDKEFLLGPPKTKPVVPEKPKVIPPPLSPTSPLPSGARPSLLTSINHALESRMINAPRVVFKDEKKDNKNLILNSNSKAEEKSERKPKENKDKNKESKEKLNEISLDHKEKNGKKPPFFGSQKESAAELVPALPPPKAKTQRKKNFLGFMKSSKKDPAATPAESILDSTNGDHAGPALLIPVASDANNMPEESIYSVPKPILSKLTIPEPSPAVDLRAIPEPPDFSPPPAIIPDNPVSRISAPQTETPPQIESSALSVSNLPNKEKVPDPLTVAPSPPLVAPPSPPVAALSPPPIVAPSPPPTAPPSPPPRAALRAIPSPPPSFANSDPPSEVFAASPSPSGLQDVAGSEVEAAHPAAEGSPSSKQERPISALSVLERAGDLSTGKRSPPSDQRILSALEKARKKASSPLPESLRPTPPPEDFPYHLNPTSADAEFPPINDEGKKALSLEPEVCDTDHRTPSLVLQNLAEGRSNTPLEQLVVPPPPRRRVLPNPQTLGPAPEKPERPPSVNLVEFIPPPPLIPEEIPVPPEFSEPDGTNVPEFEDLADAYSLELPVSESGNEEYTGPEVPDVPNQSEFYGNGIADAETEVHTETAYEDDYQENPPQEQSHRAAQDHSLPAEDPQAPYESNEDLYEPVKVSPSKKQGKINSGKKGKWAPKNPYAENAQETAQEKPKTSRFGRSEKKHASDKPDEKELKKKEKQRLEKEKKELKEKQGREKKEQKEKEKRENEMKKKFSITGHEEPMYQAKVNVTTKGRKHDLPVKSGDFISIIRTTKCPKGKWLARDSSNNYGYVSVSHLEMDFKEMIELGKRTPRSSAVTETETATDGKVLNHFSRSGESFSDDSEEWTCEDDEPYSPGGHTRTFSMPEMGNKDFAINHQHSHSDLYDNPQIQARQEALQKLATFLSSSKTVNPAPTEPSPERSPTPVQEEAVSAPPESSTQEREFDPTAVILAPPDMYADSTLDSSLYSEPNTNLPR
ncbi:uncharacterized protein V3H82_010056 [Fundulus diaphanus]